MTNYLFAVKVWLRNNLPPSNSIIIYNVYALGLAGFLGHPLYYFIWTYIDPQPYEDTALRLFGSVVSFVLLLIRFWPKFLKKYFFFYWFFAVSYNLSFLFTTYFILNSFSLQWSCAMMAQIFFTVLLLPNPLTLLFSFVIGSGFAIFYSNIISPELLNFDHKFFTTYIPLFGFALSIGYAFSFSNSRGIKSEERSKIFKSLSGSIAHELRNPLNAINLIGNQIKDNLNRELNNDNKKELLYLTSKINDSIKNANAIINMILSDLSEKEPSPQDFSYYQLSNIMPKIIDDYGYKNLDEKSKIKLNINRDNDFIFRTIEQRFTFILYNLLKNALYYLKDFPNSTIEIGGEKINYNNIEYNALYILDCGPGIPPEIIDKLFDDYFTSGKKDGTGLGLAFCRRNMRIFSGDIICQSKFGGCDESGKQISGWTKFSLLFPVLNQDELANFSAQNNASQNSANNKNLFKKILIINDEENEAITNAIACKEQLEVNLDIICDIVKADKNIIKNIKNHDYHLILINSEHLRADIIDIARAIKEAKDDMIIIAYTGLSYEDGNKNYDLQDNDLFDDYLEKPTPTPVLLRTIAKFLLPKDDLHYLNNYLATKDNLGDNLRGKKILLVDDQAINLAITKRKFESIGLEVMTANDGDEMVDIFKNNINIGNIGGAGEKIYNNINLIVTDINMARLKGDEASKQIRAIEQEHNIPHKNHIPIIALTGDSEIDDIKKYFRNAMDDYYIKGEEVDKLIKIISLYLSRHF